MTCNRKRKLRSPSAPLSRKTIGSFERYKHNANRSKSQWPATLRHVLPSYSSDLRSIPGAVTASVAQTDEQMLPYIGSYNTDSHEQLDDDFNAAPDRITAKEPLTFNETSISAVNNIRPFNPPFQLYEPSAFETDEQYSRIRLPLQRKNNPVLEHGPFRLPCTPSSYSPRLAKTFASRALLKEGKNADIYQQKLSQLAHTTSSPTSNSKGTMDNRHYDRRTILTPTSRKSFQDIFSPFPFTGPGSFQGHPSSPTPMASEPKFSDTPSFFAALDQEI